MRKVVLHVGLHKTGSSAIQETGARNRNRLEEAGYYYPEFGDTRWSNHSVPLCLLFMNNPERNHTVETIFPEQCQREDAKRQLSEALLEEVAGHALRDILLSGEDMSLLTVDELKRLKAFINSELGIEEISVILYVRNPISLALSGAQEWVRACQKTLGEVLAIGNLLQARMKIQSLREVFGDKRVTVYDFDSVVEEVGDVSRHFYEKLGVPTADLEFLRPNESMPLEKVLVVSALIQESRELARACLKVIPNEGSKLRPTDHSAAVALEVAKQDTEYLAREFGIEYGMIAYPQEVELDPYVLFRNCHIAIGESNKQSDCDVLDWARLFTNMCADVESSFPDLASKLAVLGYNCSREPVLKFRVDHLIQNGQIQGEYLGELFVADSDLSFARNFDASAYLAANPDVAAAGVDPFGHYYAFGRFSGRLLGCKGRKLVQGKVESFPVDLTTLQRGSHPAVETLGPGWQPLSVWHVESRLQILVLKSSNNNHGLWYFDADGRFIGNNAKSIWERGSWVKKAFEVLFKRLVLECVAPSQYEAHLISEAIEPLALEFTSLSEDLFATACDLTGDRDSPEGRTLNAPPAEVQDDVLSGTSGEMNLSWRGKQLSATRGIVVNHFIFTYPLFGGQCLSALLFVGFQEGIRVAWLDMDDMELFYRRVPGGRISQNLLTDFVNHLKASWKPLREYFNGPDPFKILGVTRADHIGHRLWNELTGLHRIQQNGGAEHLGALVHYDPHGIGEVWLGAPEVLQRPDLSIALVGAGNGSISRWVYENRVFPLRIGDSYIPKSLADLVASHCLEGAEVQVPGKISGELRIVFGLRFENRTWVNQSEGLAELACHLAKRFQKLTIIIDGHDRIQKRKAVSHGEHRANRDIVALEKDVVRVVREAVAGQGDAEKVTIVDAVDMELNDTMAWILSADCFVAPWGAGLAKYKWVANLDGVIFSSREVMETKPDLKIYEDSGIREGATECLYLPPQHVSRRAQDSRLVDIAGAGVMRDNFLVDMEGLKATVDRLVKGEVQ